MSLILIMTFSLLFFFLVIENWVIKVFSGLFEVFSKLTEDNLK